MAVFTRVLCPIDFSDTSAHAVRYASQIARWCGAALTVQHVYPSLSLAVPGLPEVTEGVPAGDRERLIAEVLAFASGAGAGATKPSAVVDAGRPADEIVARAARDHADLVVIGTHGSSGFKHLVLGSVTEKVLRQIACPVLTVPPRVEEPAVMPFRHVVCAVDFGPSSRAALDFSTTLAAACGAVLTAVHAIEWPWPEPPAPSFDELPQPQADALREFRRYTTDRAAAELQSMLTTVVGERCAATAEVVHGKPHVAVLAIAGAVHADLIALGVHGRSTLDVAVFGSTTNHVVRHATCPVLTIRR